MITGWHRHARGIAVAIACTMAAPFASAQAPAADTQAERPFLGGFLQDSRILYPLKIGDWVARDEHMYEQAELGASVRYQHGDIRDRWIDVYFYPAGIVPDAHVREMAQGTVEGIRALPGNSGLPAGGLETSRIELGSDENRRHATLYSSGFTLARDGKRYASAMTLLAKDLYYIKGRYSGDAAAHTPEALHDELKDFTVRLVRETRLYSTGECWMPPPIVQVDAPDPEATGALVNISTEGKAHAVGFADRVDAVDPRSSQAILTQFMAYTASGRWVDGCHPPEDMTPDVPDGMRELRFEYRAPPERSDGSTPRLRSPRSGVG
jgi:hypothetical protein